ncbi:hypothetical protein LTS12_027111 [Elasticomyces elasticus]|nr:hypothetical protein LTS12_027111 [Elasticomyces elasticus]
MEPPLLPPSPPSRGTKRSASGEPLIGKNRISSLYKPEIVSIFIYEEDDKADKEDEDATTKEREMIEYQVPRGLIRASSEYFDKAFGDDFEEGKTRKIVLADVLPWVFECFIGWLYTQKVFWEYQATGKHGDGTRSQPFIINQLWETDHFIENTGTPEADLLDSVNWDWGSLFELYAFADKYNTMRLRTATMDAICTKTFQTKPYAFSVPDFGACAKLFEELPDSSPLSRFLVDVLTHLIRPPRVENNDEEHEPLLALPPRILSRLLARNMQMLSCARCEKCRVGNACDSYDHFDIKTTAPPYTSGFCSYHVHDCEEERLACQARWERITTDKGKDM